MQSKQGLLLAAEVLSGLDGPVKAIREATPQARHSFTVADQVNRMCCNFPKAARERLVESAWLRLMPPPRTSC